MAFQPPPPDPRDHPVIDLYRATPASIAAAKAAAAKERAEVDAMLREGQLWRYRGVQATRQLVAEYGQARIIQWARNAPALDGNLPAVEREAK